MSSATQRSSPSPTGSEPSVDGETPASNLLTTPRQDALPFSCCKRSQGARYCSISGFVWIVFGSHSQEPMQRRRAREQQRVDAARTEEQLESAAGHVDHDPIRAMNRLTSLNVSWPRVAAAAGACANFVSSALGLQVQNAGQRSGVSATLWMPYRTSLTAQQRPPLICLLQCRLYLLVADAVVQLATSLQDRPSRDRLRAAGILLDASEGLSESHVDRSLLPVRSRINRQRELDILSRKLKNRPSHAQLTAGNILKSEL